MWGNKYIQAVIIVILFWLGSYLVTFLLNIIEKFTSKTGTDLDDKIIEAVKLPIRYLAILLGLFYAGRDLNLSWSIKDTELGLADIFFSLLILLIGYTGIRILKSLFDWYSDRSDKGKMSQTMFVFLRKMISVFVYIIAIMIIFSQLGIEISPLLAGLGVFGLAIAFGLKETMSNLFAALFLVMDKSINIGDWIEMEDGTKAFIDDISWRSVRIRTKGGNSVIVPNSVFVGQKISSYDFPNSPFYTSIEVGVSYDTDLEKAEYVANQAAEKIIQKEDIKIQDNNPTVRYTLLGDSAINFSVYIKIDKVQDEGRIKHALIKEIVKQFREQNIEIPFPQMVVHKAEK